MKKVKTFGKKLNKPRILIGLSYGHRGQEPGSSNRAIARTIKRIKNKSDMVLVQHEIGKALKKLGVNSDFQVYEHRKGKDIYLNTEEVIDQMIIFLKKNKINFKNSEFLGIGHPIHWSGINMISKNKGLYLKRINAQIPYDQASFQWYTRDPMRAWIYKFWAGFNYMAQGKIKIF